MADTISPDVIRLGLVLGVVFSVALYERFQVTTGGLIVPGYLASMIGSPVLIVSTLAAAYATHRLISGPVANRAILYGRRKFEIEVLIGLGLGGAFFVIAAIVGGLRQDPLAAGIGFVLPGLVAHDMTRQGARPTFIAVAGATGIVVALVAAVGALDGVFAGGRGIVPLPAAAVASSAGIPPLMLLVAVFASVGFGLVIHAFSGTRTGGFVSAAYLALVFPNLVDLVFTVVIAALTLVVVDRVLTPRMHIFGRRKLAAMLIVAMLTGWSVADAAATLTDGAISPWAGFGGIGLIVPALLANDAERQGVPRTVAGVCASTVLVLVVTSLLGAALAG